MTQHEPYSTSRGVESAIKEAAKRQAAGQPSLSVNKRIQLEYFNRFLSRVFSERDGSEWVLKGGTGILARVPSTRSTQDIDLYRKGFTLKQSLDDLNRLAALDLGDHFRFEYAGHTDSIGNDAQPYTEGYRVKFNIFIGLAPRGTLHVDLAVGAGVTGVVVTKRPATALDLPRLASNPYHLYPVVDQIADKVCATMANYRERTSSREKDLVDLVVLAATHDIDGTKLRIAITTETRRRTMKELTRFAVPATWGAGYANLSSSVPHCTDYATVDRASALAGNLVDPALSGEADGKTWSHTLLDWA
ncbi:nucleotidyl transferase AbiEii/AbiGii toxin family protein [Nesterenkonia sp. E16_7]|uniref:nucleotidyl transferase AbiEii/AbiGii toxin family protein n=1 Tax=unclassified Nesterenkonia TaxID=2629769 RepID=UPI001A91CF47|nr:MULTISPECIES: nucleotidyl transferase AbiEii/AbiGii toxin family protein [unclassified Nesterenkonia]MBO0594862.1 nucleotidyl transferase AbiEii/AbiGii toxin family protein [Nesterenkonia sp. E16_10]MBO0597111.1 nucleotidyl transferase AbiEii/AbiGii toxin family protein [Nesterenkonia sp. E16_7]